MVKKFLSALVVLALAGGLALWGVVHWSQHKLRHTPLHHENTESYFDFPTGQTVRHLPTLLAEAGFLASEEREALALALRIQLRLHPDLARVHAGEYDLRSANTVQDVLDLVREGKVVRHAITIVEGTRFRDLKALLRSKNNITHEIIELSDADIMAALGKAGEHPEGWFAPDTFHYTKGDTDLAILQRALSTQEQRLAAAWESRQPNLPYDSPYELLIMASIIERETGVPSERPDIAGVFVRRLQKGMRLQTDPTVIYGMGEAYVGRITRKDLRTPTPYNTYTIFGLPPTPIAMPGAKALEAAANPAEGKALYFVAKGDGTHHFSATLAEHEAAVRRYQLNRRADYRSSPAETVQ